MNGRLFGFISSHPPQQQQTAAAAAESDQSRERESVCVRTEGRKKCGGLEEDHAQSKLIRESETEQERTRLVGFVSALPDTRGGRDGVWVEEEEGE
jgi:hypothetical protein